MDIEKRKLIIGKRQQEATLKRLAKKSGLSRFETELAKAQINSVIDTIARENPNFSLGKFGIGFQEVLGRGKFTPEQRDGLQNMLKKTGCYKHVLSRTPRPTCVIGRG